MISSPSQTTHQSFLVFTPLSIMVSPLPRLTLSMDLTELSLYMSVLKTKCLLEADYRTTFYCKYGVEKGSQYLRAISTDSDIRLYSCSSNWQRQQQEVD